MKEKIVKIFFIFIILVLVIYAVIKFISKNKISKVNITQSLNTSENIEDSKKEINEETYKSNIIKDVNYSSKDAKGNEYIIDASEGEIDYSETNIIYLTNVVAVIKLIKDNTTIKVTSDYGKYNTDNFDTIFSKNVIIKYLDNEIKSEYLDFSIERNSMIVSRKVIYNNFENILKADVIEINIETKDTKIFMYEENKKVNIKSKN